MLLLTNTIRPADHDQDEICRPHTVPLCCFSHYLLPNTVRFWNTREGEKIKTEHNRPIVWWTTLLDNLSCSFILPSLHPVIHHALLRAQNSYTEGAGNVLVFIIASECELQLWNRLRDVICYCDLNLSLNQSEHQTSSCTVIAWSKTEATILCMAKSSFAGEFWRI